MLWEVFTTSPLPISVISCPGSDYSEALKVWAVLLNFSCQGLSLKHQNLEALYRTAQVFNAPEGNLPLMGKGGWEWKPVVKCCSLSTFKETILRSFQCAFQRSYHCLQQQPRYWRFIYFSFFPCPVLSLCPPASCVHFPTNPPALKSLLQALLFEDLKWRQNVTFELGVEWCKEEFVKGICGLRGQVTM